MDSFIYFWRKSPFITVSAIVAGLLCGAGNIGLLSLINTVLSNYHTLDRFVMYWFLGFCALILTTQYLSMVLLAHLSQKATVDLRLQLSRQILGAPLRCLESLGPHRLLAALTHDVSSIAQVSVFLPRLCIDFAMVIGCLIYLAWLSWVTFLTVFGFALVGVCVYKVILRRATPVLDAVREDQDILQKHFHTLTEGTKELMSHRRRREDYFSKNLDYTIASLRRRNLISARIFAGAAGWSQIIFYLLVATLLFAPLTASQTNYQVMIGCILAVLFLRVPLEGLVAFFPSLGFASASLRKIESLGLTLGANPSNSSATPVLEPNPDWSRLDLIGSLHTYISPEADGSKFVLGPLHFSFRRGELIFIAGGNGSGKTTFAKLLAGLYIPEAGQISIDGQPVDDTNRESYRQYFSTVFSDFYLFDALLGLDSPDSESRAQNYLTKLQLNNKVKIREGVFSTTELSQGQRKRLALLTAYLEDRPIYIFDEWAADQDPVFKDVFYCRLLPELKSRNKTVFVISHDDRYYSLADRVIKLEYGQVCADYKQAPHPIEHHSIKYQQSAFNDSA